MTRFINITNKTFGDLLILGRVENNKHGKAMWLCRCVCKECHKDFHTEYGYKAFTDEDYFNWTGDKNER